MEEIKLSVIVPVHNNEAFLPQTLESLTHQTLDGIEIICIDNGSTDGSLDILKSYEAVYPNISVYAQKDMGQAYSMNRGLRLANGEYVAECDSDDFVMLDCYRRAYELATSPLLNTKADVVRFGWFGIFPDGTLQPQFYEVNKNYVGVPLNPIDMGEEEYGAIFRKQIALFAGIYRRQFLLDNELFWREGINYEDTAVEWKIRCLAKDYRIIAEPLYYYRRGNPNSGTETIVDDDAIYEQFDEIERFIKERGLPYLEVMNASRYKSYIWSMARGDMTKERVTAEFEKMEAVLKDRPTKRIFFSESKDWINYNLVRYGAWKETGILA